MSIAYLAVGLLPLCVGLVFLGGFLFGVVGILGHFGVIFARSLAVLFFTECATGLFVWVAIAACLLCAVFFLWLGVGVLTL